VTAVSVVTFTAVMVLGVLVVTCTDVLRQAVVNGIFGLCLVALFVVLQAPDVALSELVVGSVAFPLVILAAIARTEERPGPK
jgi:energy-converting hydrogenase B subunit D